jgi:hypothetical protein
MRACSLTRILTAALVMLLGAGGALAAVVAADSSGPETASLGQEWGPLAFLLGEWEGGGTGAPGVSEGQFSFSADLGGRILVRRNDTTTPEGLHQDLMIVYPSGPGSFRAIYFDSEGHVINYAVSTSDFPAGAVFLSDELAGVPRFRLSYRLNADGTLAVAFEMAPPGGSEFSGYLQGVASRR